MVVVADALCRVCGVEGRLGSATGGDVGIDGAVGHPVDGKFCVEGGIQVEVLGP